MKHFLLAAALMTATSPAYAIVNTKECAAIRAYNAKAPSMAAMKSLPCHCIPMGARVDKVYSSKKPAPPGFTCGNHAFYDKQCHEGVTCYREGDDSPPAPGASPPMSVEGWIP
jgi:hypothetical protein